MGLDMFLNCRRKGADVEEESREVAYWRKASGILNWFDNNLSSVSKKNAEMGSDSFDRDGVRNCIEYEVQKDEYFGLIEDCKEVLKTKEVPDDMVPIPGFFFGSTEVDDYYWEYINDTINQLEYYADEIDWDNDQVYFSIWY